MAKDLRPLDPSDEEIEEQGEITPEDIERAKAQYRQDADPEWSTLLDAEPIPEEL